MLAKGRMHQLRASAWLILLTALPGTVWAADNAPSKQSLEELRSRIESLKKELESTQASHSEAADALKKSERAISEAKRRLHSIGIQQAANRQALELQQAEKSRLDETIHQQQQLLSQQLYQQYVTGQASHLQILLSQRDPVSVARELRYYSYVARARAEQIASLKSNLDKVAELNERTAATLEEIEQLKTEQEQQRRQLEAEKQDRKEVLANLSKQIRSQRGEISKLRRDEKQLTELVRKLARVVPAKPKRSSSSVVRRNDSLPTPDLPSVNFAALKGKLRLPVRGDIINRFGTLREGSGISWKGLFIKAGEGSQVKSIAGGIVVFADWLRGFGNLLIIDHGEGYMSLYGNNQTLLKQVGDSVVAGDDIAAVGNTGGNEEAGVYFELRHQSQPFDPLIWCSLR
jgi:septal ring factor EnvC (AmiA/AmiB activator)